MARRNKGSEGNAQHFTAVRMRLTGSGALQMTLHSLSDTRSLDLVDFTMAVSTNREVTRLCNFTEQRAYLEIKTTEINEIFRISKIVIFTRPVTTGEFPSVA